MRKNRLSDDQIQQIAVLLAEYGKKQNEIAKIMGETTATISRAVATAKSQEKQYLRQQKFEITENISESNRTAARRHLGMEQLELYIQQQLSPYFEGLYVVTTSTSNPYVTFGQQAADVLANLLKKKKFSHAGISWGYTLQCVAQKLPSVYSPRSGSDIICVPIAGGSPPDLRETTSSAALAEEFSQILNGPEATYRSFSIGSWIPKEFTQSEIDVIRRFAKTSPSYKATFQKNGYTSNLDCIITSVGAMLGDSESSPWQEAAQNAADDIDLFRNATVGNIAGCFLPRLGCTSEEKEAITKVNNRWLGAQLSDIENCAKRAKWSEKPGVIVLAVGGKSDVVIAAIRSGLVNYLIIDELTMNGIVATLSNGGGNTFAP